MGWLGKFVGGTVGFALGGPLGAVLGATFGHAFDSESKFNKKGTYNYASLREQQQLTFFVAAFSMLGKLVKVDGRISNEEIKIVKKFIAEDLKLQGYSSNVAMNIFKTALNSPQTFEDFSNQFYEQFYGNEQMLEFMIDIMLQVSISDGYISNSEEELIIHASNVFNIHQSKYEQLKSKYVGSNLNKYYSILGCKGNENNEKLKNCYRQKVREYHPDKISSKGLPDEFTKFSQDKFREIQEAWERIKKERNLI